MNERARIARVISPQLDRFEKVPEIDAEPARSDARYATTEKCPHATGVGIVPDLPDRIEEKEDDCSRDEDLVCRKDGHCGSSADITSPQTGEQMNRPLVCLSPSLLARWLITSLKQAHRGKAHAHAPKRIRESVTWEVNYGDPAPRYDDVGTDVWSRPAPLGGEPLPVRPTQSSRTRKAALNPYMMANSGDAAMPNLLCTPDGVSS